MIEGIQSTFPAYDGIGMNFSIQVDATKFLDDLEGDVPEDVYGSPRSGTDLSLQGTYNQLLERQRLFHSIFDCHDITPGRETLLGVELEGKKKAPKENCKKAHGSVQIQNPYCAPSRDSLD
ncbi:hypothetical protein HPP92_026376 [Vanilla planifolia]|uniref:Uncharacterized protein n=1 Tax=Vanilla planifolia TaxID=51239 RepID=A0A835PFW3_VANPL|nr:hypothetical protein HPP92_026376 [Vanilla planifolia]